MAYDPKAENVGHFKRITRDLLVFSGRSQPTEVLMFFLLLSSAGILLTFLDQSPRSYFLIFLCLFVTPQFARRLHDINRTGWFAVIVPILLALKAWGQWQYDAGILPTPSVGFPYSAVSIVLVITFWAVVFWPGTKGENRFGPDPRLEQVAPAV